MEQPTATDAEILLTAKDLAMRWQLTSGHIYELARTNAIPCVRLGRRKRFRLDAIKELELSGGTSNPLNG